MVKKTNFQSKNQLCHTYEQQNIQNQQLRQLAIKNVKKFIKNDRKVTKISKSQKSCFKTIVNQKIVEKPNFQQVFDQKSFQCPICLQLMIQPTLLECGHAYCAKCLEQAMIYKSICSVCRHTQTDPEFKRSKMLETIIQKILLKKQQNFLNYYCRTSDNENWKNTKKVNTPELQKGSFIDFRDQELKWRKVQIYKIQYVPEKNYFLIEVRYKKDGQIFSERISSESNRYAKFTYYTRMKFLQPHLNTTQIDIYHSDSIICTPLSSNFLNIPFKIDQCLNFEQFQSLESLWQQNVETDQQNLNQLDLESEKYINEFLNLNQRIEDQFIELLV